MSLLRTRISGNGRPGQLAYEALVGATASPSMSASSGLVLRAGRVGLRSRGPRGDWSVGGASIWWAFWAWSDPERRWAPESEPPFPRLWSPVLPLRAGPARPIGCRVQYDGQWREAGSCKTPAPPGSSHRRLHIRPLQAKTMTKRSILVLLLASVAGACDASTKPTPVSTPSTPTPTSGPDEWATDLYPLINATRRAGLTCEDGRRPTIRRHTHSGEDARPRGGGTDARARPRDDGCAQLAAGQPPHREQRVVGRGQGAVRGLSVWRGGNDCVVARSGPAGNAGSVSRCGLTAPRDCEVMMNPQWVDVGVGFAQAKRLHRRRRQLRLRHGR